MGALLVKEAPEELHQWLKDEAKLNRRSLNQQILICLEWCMQTYGMAQMRNPFASSHPAATTALEPQGILMGDELAAKIKSIATISDEDAKEMKKAVRGLRSAKMRSFEYGRFA